MSKHLKDFIGENRRAFDDELPSPMAWDKIEKSISRKKKGRILGLSPYKWVAAAAIVCIGSTLLYFGVFHRPEPAPSNGESQPAIKGGGDAQRPGVPIEFGGVSPDYAVKAKRIFESIERQQEQLKQMAADQPALYSQFSQDLVTLDSSYRVLKNQAVQAPNQEIIIKAMMQNLQLQAELLSKQLLIINEYKNNKKETNEKDAYRPI